MLTAERLRELLTYDPATGLFRWRVTAGSRAQAGQIASTVNGAGYIVIGVGGQKHYAHRLAFLYMIGEWPTHDVDHKDGDKGNNRWSNLRAATRTQNNANTAPTAKSGVKGVYPNKNKWSAKIQHQGEVIHLGTYPTVQQAASVYAAAARDLHGEFARVT